MSNKSKQDVEITAYPNKDKARVTCVSVGGKEFVESICGPVNEASPLDIAGEDVNKLLKSLKEKDLTFSFRAA
jgi:tRNA-binding EMAP/Myf-like protein